MNEVKQLTLVEFPGALSNPEDPRKAIDALGGENAVRTSVAMPFSEAAPPLTLNLRPGLTSSPSNIVAEKPKPTTNLFLLKINQDSSNGAGKDVEATACIEGRITSVTTFKALSDFQFHSVSNLRKLSQLNSSVEAVPHRSFSPSADNGLHRLEMVGETIFEMLKQDPGHSDAKDTQLHIDMLRPLRFTRGIQEYGTSNYWFRQYGMNNDADDTVKHPNVTGSFGKDRRSDVNRLDSLHYRISMDVPQVPLHSDPALAPPVLRGRDAFDTLYELVSKLFEERPIWIRRALFEFIPDDLKKSFKRVICMIAYCFQGAGPFFQAWIKYGYDPRKDPYNRKYQVLEIRFNHPIVLEAVRMQAEAPINVNERETEASDRGVARMLSHLPFQRNYFVQICDIKLEQVAKFCEQEPCVSTFDKKYGFFSKEGHEKLISIVKSTMVKLSEQILGKERCMTILQDRTRLKHASVKRKQPRLQLRRILEGVTPSSAPIYQNERVQRKIPKVGHERGMRTVPIDENNTSSSVLGANNETSNEITQCVGNENQNFPPSNDGEGDDVNNGNSPDEYVHSLAHAGHGTQDVAVEGSGTEGFDLEQVEGYEIYGDDAYDEEEDDDDFDDDDDVGDDDDDDDMG